MYLLYYYMCSTNKSVKTS